MKLLMNALSARRGGIFTYTLNLAKSIDDNEIDVCIGAPPHLASTIGPGSLTIDVSHMGPIRRLAWEQSVWRKIVKRESPDVLFSSANFALFASSVPQLLLMREGGLFNPYYLKSVFPQLGLRARMATVLRRQIMLYSVRSATRVMFPSESLRDWVADWEPSIAETGIINHYGIDLSRFTMGQDRPPLDRNRIKLLYVSVYYPHKDPCTLSRAVDALRDSGIGADATITMAEQEFDLWYSGRTDYEELTQSEQRGRVTLGSVDFRRSPRHSDSHWSRPWPAVSPSSRRTQQSIAKFADRSRSIIHRATPNPLPHEYANLSTGPVSTGGSAAKAANVWKRTSTGVSISATWSKF
jgi:glycosyltransferase involved in cell wall biosynthesis